jgi:hypothetical protein
MEPVTVVYSKIPKTHVVYQNAVEKALRVFENWRNIVLFTRCRAFLLKLLDEKDNKDMADITRLDQFRDRIKPLYSDTWLAYVFILPTLPAVAFSDALPAEC